MEDHLYSTYIVASRSQTLYIGVTGDLKKNNCRFLRSSPGDSVGMTPSR